MDLSMKWLRDYVKVDEPIKKFCYDMTMTGSKVEGYEIEAECVTARAEEAVQTRRESYDVATSRAVARLRILLELTAPYVKVGGVFLAMKASDCEEELERAKTAIKTLGGEVKEIKEYKLYGTDITHKVIVIEKISNTPEKYPRRFAKIKSQPIK